MVLTAPRYDLLVVTDATASMGPFLNALNEALPEIISMSTLTGTFERVGVIAYRDYGSSMLYAPLIEWLGWYEVGSADALPDDAPSTPDTVSQADLIARVRALEPSAGGDIPEAAKTGLAKAFSVMRPDTTTIILMYADAPPHSAATKGDNHKDEQTALNKTGTDAEYLCGPLFADWAKASALFRSGGPEKRCAQVFSFVNESDPKIAGPFAYLSNVTSGACLETISVKPAALSQLTIGVLLAWMGVKDDSGEKNASSVPVAKALNYKAGRDKLAKSEKELTSLDLAGMSTNPDWFAIRANITPIRLFSNTLSKAVTPRAGEPLDLVARYRTEADYANLVHKQLRNIITTNVKALTANPIFGTLWRAVASNRDSRARDELLELFSAEVSKAGKASPEDGAMLKAWLESSYDFAGEIEKLIAEIPAVDRFPCVLLDPTLDFTPPANVHADAEASRAVNDFTRPELLEIGRSCDPVILSRLGRVLTRLTYVKSADDLPPHIDDSVKRIPLALATDKHRDMFWRVLLHLVISGTMISPRSAALLAALALRSGLAPLRDVADAELLRAKDWADINIPETWSAACLGLLLDADAEYERRVKSGETKRPDVVKTVNKGKDKKARTSAEPRILSPDTRALFQALVEYKALERNLRTTVTARVGWHPDKARAPLGPVTVCSKCHMPRSVTMMTAQGSVCGLCAAPCPSNCDSCKDAPHDAERCANKVTPNDTPETPATWVECSIPICRAQYVVYNPDALRVRAKCYHCRHRSTPKPGAEPWLECSTCTNRVIFPKKYRPSTMVRSGKWKCYACDGGMTTIVDAETNANVLRKENGNNWLVDPAGAIPPAGLFDMRSLYHTASTANRALFNKVKVLPTADATLTLDARHVHNAPDVVAQLRKWVAARRAEQGTCDLCASSLPKAALIRACGRKGCVQTVCMLCKKGWYGLNAKGHVINTAALHCAFCRRLPAASSVAEFGTPRLGNLLNAVEDRGWIYAWCRTCNSAQQYVARECARGAPRTTDFQCPPCVEETERAVAAEIGRLEEEARRAAQEQRDAVTAARRAEVAREVALLTATLQPTIRTLDCPGCGVATEKTDGCNHIHCPRPCNTHWCFGCGWKGVNADRVYAHMDKEHGSMYLYVEDYDD